MYSYSIKVKCKNNIILSNILTLKGTLYRHFLLENRKGTVNGIIFVAHNCTPPATYIATLSSTIKALRTLSSW